MAQVKDLTRLTLTDLWREVKEDFWGDVSEETLRLVRRLLESTIKGEGLSISKPPGISGYHDAPGIATDTGCVTW